MDYEMSSFLVCNSRLHGTIQYIDIILYISTALGRVKLWCLRSCWPVLSLVTWGRPGCLLLFAGGEVNRIFLASALSSIHAMCPNSVSWCDWIIAVSLGRFVRLHTSSFWAYWCHFMPSTICSRRCRLWHATVRLRSAIRRHHPPQRAVLSQICCFGEHKVVLFQILLDGAEPHDVGTTWLSSPVCWRGG